MAELSMPAITDALGGDDDLFSPKSTPGARPMVPPDEDPNAPAAAREKAEYFKAQREQLERAGAREEELYARREEEMAPQRAELRQSLSDYYKTSQQATARMLSKQQEIPQFDGNQAKGDAWSWMMMSAGLASIAGAFSRYHTTTALNAFSGMMNGFAKGELTVYEQKYKEWSANADRAQEYNRRAVDEYKAIMANQKLGLDVKSNLMEMTANKWQDAIMANSARIRDIERMTQQMNAQERFDEGLKLRKDRLDTWKQTVDTNLKMRLERIYGGLGDAESAADMIRRAGTRAT